MSSKLPRSFYARPTLIVARGLLNQRLVRIFERRRLSGRIVEVEAYSGMDDAASHARFGETERNAAMFGPPGHAYVYLIYGIHHCLNLVTEEPGFPAAILIRALEPIEGLEVQQRLRGPERPFEELTRGPGRLCQALAIDRGFDGLDLCASESPLWVEEEPGAPPEAIARSPRVGVTGDQEARSVPWRFFIQDNPWVSR
ncbi:MAG: DNA-3-methyladenine glycosylase [Anaerolineales bacterium]